MMHTWSMLETRASPEFEALVGRGVEPSAI